MARLGGLGDLTTREWQRLEEVADRFEQACLNGVATADLERFLPPPGDPLRPAILSELVKIDLEACWRHGHPRGLEHYLDNFPELGPRQALAPQFLYEEYRVRHLYGDKPGAATYQRRFPEQFSAFEGLLRTRPLNEYSTHPSANPGIAGAAAVPLRDETSAAEKRVTQTAKPKDLAVVGEYRLLERLGSGNFGEVWRAEAPGGVEVAIKRLFQPLTEETVRRELLAQVKLGCLHHPYLLQAHAFWVVEDRLVIIMELAETTLRQRLNACRATDQKCLPLPEVLQYMREAAEALDYLHQSQVFHRDVKPENILLVQGHAKVADFGMARVREASSQMMSTQGGGTPRYMAPEIWRGQFNARSDQYSLAAVYVEVRLGRPVFAPTDMAQLMYEHVNSVPDLKPLSAAEQEVLLIALAKEPSLRYPTCRAFLAALQDALRTESAAPPSLVPTPTRRRFLLLAGSGWATAATAAGLGWWWNRAAAPPVAPPDTSPAVWLPEGGEPTPGARLIADVRGHSYYETLQLQRGGQVVTFRLIPKQTRHADLDTFYIMENKVWVGLFQVALADAEFEKLLETEKLKAHKNLRDQVVRKEWTLDKEALPVRGLTVLEAYCLARWLGGNLPTLHQWEKAAGCFEPGSRRGPYDPIWDQEGEGIAVKLGEPLPVGTAERDRSIFQVRDMAGNGREWTRNLSLYQGKSIQPGPQTPRVPVPNPSGRDAVWLRGCSFDSVQPLHFADLNREDNGQLTRSYLETDKDLTCRVVLEPP